MNVPPVVIESESMKLELFLRANIITSDLSASVSLGALKIQAKRGCKESEENKQSASERQKK